MERLKLLTLLTYADISAVNPTAMTPWRLEQLWQVYLMGHAEFTRELDTERIHASTETSPEAAAFLEGLPTRYLKTHTPAEIAHHVELSRRDNAVDLVRLSGNYRLTVIASDRPFLLASIAGALASFGMNILKAEAFANSRGQAVDGFVFADPHRTLELNPDEHGRVQDLVVRSILGKVDLATLIDKRRRPVSKPRVKPAVSFSNNLSDTCTLIEIVAEDRPGLLYDLARTLSTAGANIEVVLIDTEAHLALDVFYVTSEGLILSQTQMVLLKDKLQTVSGG
jgi:[protein-PII] uridylyltransferase